MPRRGSFRPRDNWNQVGGSGNLRPMTGTLYSDAEPDNRKPTTTKRRVTFKPFVGVPGRSTGVNLKPKFNKLIANSLRGEDDEEMVEFVNSGKGAGFRGDKQRRKGSPLPRRQQSGGYKKLIATTANWFLVTIPYGHKYEKDLLIRSILSAISPDIFIPHYWKLNKDSVQFYLDEIEIAEKLLNLDRTIQMPDGFKMLIRVRNSIPTVQLDETLKEKMKLAMVKRYTPATKALDLSKFHADDDLQDIFCGLARPTIMLTALDIIAVNIPDLEALNLENNKIYLMDHFKCMEEKLPFLKILYLKNNKIGSMSAIDSLKNLPLVDISLEGNPIKSRYRDETTYVSEIRKRLPKLMKLDGNYLPPQIGFDIEGETTLPQANASFLCDTAGADIVRQFIEQYFIIFDSNNRQPLLEAYHENALLSISVASAQQQKQRLASFWPFNRNLLRHKDLDTRCRQIRTGRLPVVSLLSELPATQHDPQSFSVDLALFTSRLISFSVTGVFRELPTKSSEFQSPQLRSFHRTYMVVPSGAGFCIRNEIIHITNITQSQLRTAFKPIDESPSAGPSTSQVIAPTPIVTTDDTTRMRMIEALSTQTNMNLEWSKKCLEETHWDYSHASNVFTALHKDNRIPAEAFRK